MAAELVQAAKQHEAEVLARHPEAEALQIKSLLRAVVGRRGLERGVVETAVRGGEDGEVSVENAAAEIAAQLDG